MPKLNARGKALRAKIQKKLKSQKKRRIMPRMTPKGTMFANGKKAKKKA